MNKARILFLVLIICLACRISTAQTIASYDVQLMEDFGDQNTVNVKAVFPAGIGRELHLSNNNRDWEEYEEQIIIKKAYDSQGKDIRVEKTDQDTWGVNSDSGFTIEYSAHTAIPFALNLESYPTYLAYVSKDCGLVHTGRILLAPQGEGNIKVNFALPESWKIMVDETWKKTGENSFETSLRDLYALIALGKIDVYSESFGDNQKLNVGVCGKTKYDKSKYLPGLKTCADYFHENVGKLPQKELNVFITELPLPGDYMGEPFRITINRADRSWGMFEGMIWHYWFLRPAYYKNDEEGGKVWWFGEALSPFILYPIYKKLDVVPEIEKEQWEPFTFPDLSWKNWQMIFEPSIGTKYDIALVDYYRMNQETGDRGYYHPVPYIKGDLVLEMLDESMTEVTHGKKDIKDVTKYIYENYALKGIGYTIEDVLNAFNTVSGNDYSDFFKAYIFGNERFPILKEGNDYRFDWSVLGDKTYASVPNKEKARPLVGLLSRDSKETVNLELKKESKHFAVYFHPQDSEEAALMLLGAERAYNSVAKVYGGEPKLKIKMFMTYDKNEATEGFGYNPPGGLTEDSSGGGPSSDIGDELMWLKTISKKETWILSSMGIPHELGHVYMRQLYPGIYFTGAKSLSEVPELVKKGMYNEYWLSWFSEGLATYAALECWLDNVNEKDMENLETNVVINRDAFKQLIESAKTKNPPLVELSKLNDINKDDMKSVYLSEAETMSFFSYIYQRYGKEGMHKLLSEYDKGVTVYQAAENAFGTSFAELEKDWKSLIEKTATNNNIVDKELERIRKEGFDTSKVMQVKKQEPFLALFMAYTIEKYTTPCPPPIEVSEQTSGFPWLILIILIIIIAVLVLITRKVIKSLSKKDNKTTIPPDKKVRSHKILKTFLIFLLVFVILIIIGIPLLIAIILSGIILGLIILIRKVIRFLFKKKNLR
ncbi:MAG: hypothetical protein Q8N77_02285 [Nanoarchaeota archaeon]|nr:hypothetical protein [Nanoarchaeota archaeon]